MIADLRFKNWFERAALALLLSTLNHQLSTAFAFEGRINVVTTRGGQTDALLYTIGTNFLRVEMTATNWPNAVDILDRNSGELTLLFPNNRSLVRLKPAADDSSTQPSGFPQMPGASAMPNLPALQDTGPTNLPGAPAMPPMPAAPNMNMPPPMMEKMELRATGQKTNRLGFACEEYEIKQRGETMEIWATDQLFPFQPYVLNQPHRFGPRMIEEQWAGLVKARKLFPLLATLKFDNGPERFRFEVTAVMPEKLSDEDAKLFQPPDGYFEMEPLPF